MLSELADCCSDCQALHYLPELGRFWADDASIDPELAQCWHVNRVLHQPLHPVVVMEITGKTINL